MITAGQSTTAACVNVDKLHAYCHDCWFPELDLRSLPVSQGVMKSMAASNNGGSHIQT